MSLTRSVSYTHLDVYKRQANDWILSASSCCRNYSNLVGGSSNGIYVEATLDNSFKENTSALVSCDLALTSLINDTTYFPVSSNDADGDSVTLELVAPMTYQGNPATYLSGYSATMPLGTGAVCEFTNNNSVSYTHLDVYKRQVLQNVVITGANFPFLPVRWHRVAAYGIFPARH